MDKLKEKKQTYEAARDAMLESIQRGGGLVSVTLATDYWSAAEVYIGLLNDEIDDYRGDGAWMSEGGE